MIKIVRLTALLLLACSGATPAAAQTASTQTLYNYVNGLPAISSLAGSEKILALQGSAKTTTPWQIVGTVIGDCTSAVPPTVVCTKTNGAVFAPSATTDATNAANINTGILSAARLPAFSGDVSTSAGSSVTTLATVNTNIGAFGSATQCTSITTNGKGLITAASAVTCTPQIASVTGLGTGVATALGVNTGLAGAIVVNGGALGTPTSGTLTNATGLPLSTGVTGILQAAQFPALTGDVTTTAGALATTLAAAQAAAHTWSAVQTFNGAQTVFNPTTGVGGVAVNGPAASALTLDLISVVGQNSYVRMGAGSANMEFQTDPSGNWLLNTTGVAVGVLKLNRTASAANTFVMDKGHIGNAANTPTISVCGTAPSVARGSDFAGEVTTGTGAVTTCTITFGVAYTSAPYCTVTNQNGAALTYNISTTAIAVTAGSGTSNKLNWFCSGT